VRGLLNVLLDSEVAQTVETYLGMILVSTLVKGVQILTLANLGISITAGIDIDV